LAEAEMPLPAPPAGEDCVNSQAVRAIASSLVFSDETVEAARSAKSVKRVEGEPPGDGATNGKEAKRVPTSTA